MLSNVIQPSSVILGVHTLIISVTGETRYDVNQQLHDLAISNCVVPLYTHTGVVYLHISSLTTVNKAHFSCNPLDAYGDVTSLNFIF